MRRAQLTGDFTYESAGKLITVHPHDASDLQIKYESTSPDGKIRTIYPLNDGSK
jgi:hypothetical protein